jgi:hypothetical protein
MKITTIWKHLKAGRKVYWCHEGYQVLMVPYDLGLNKYSKLSLRDKQALRVTCMDNYFGSLICESDLPKCFAERSKVK